MGFPGGSDDKESACNAGDPGSIPGFGGSPGEGNGYPSQYSCLENSIDRGAEMKKESKSIPHSTFLTQEGKGLGVKQCLYTLKYHSTVDQLHSNRK